MSDVQYDPNDALFGAPAIAEFLNGGKKKGRWNPRKVYHAHERKSMPLGKLGSLIIGSKRKLAAHLNKATDG